MPHIVGTPTVGPELTGQRIDPYTGFRFRVTALGIPSWRMGFKTIEGIEDETEVVEYREGTDRMTKKLPGIHKSTELVLMRGKSRSNDLQIWRSEVAIAQKRAGFPSPTFRRTLKIQIMDDFNRRLKGFTYVECWPNKLSHGSLDAGTSDVWTESVTVQNEGGIPDPFDLKEI